MIQPGITLDEFSKYAATLKPHPLKATIFIEADKDVGGMEKIYSVLNTAGFIPIETKVILEESPNWILIFLSSDDMREATLKLSEAGFVKVVGMNPKPSTRNSTYYSGETTSDQ
jgi:hypothetical protein